MNQSLLRFSLCLALAACGSGTRATQTSSTSALTVRGSVAVPATDIYAVEASAPGTQPTSVRARIAADKTFSLDLPRDRTYVITVVNAGRVLGSVRFATTRGGSLTTNLLHLPAEVPTTGQALEGALELGEVDQTSDGNFAAQKNPLAMLDTDGDGEEDLDDADDDGDGKDDAEDDDADGDGKSDDDVDHDEDDDGKIDAADDDDDGDGTPDAMDADHGGESGDHDGDGVSDSEDEDDDNDGLEDSDDNDDNDDGSEDAGDDSNDGKD